MAKFEEADPRWIVEEREDGKNVNNWHWTEKDCTSWSKSKLEALYKDAVVVSEGDTVVTITGSKEISGEVTVSTRKGKAFHYYELDISLKWQGKTKRGDSIVSEDGTIHAPYISEECKADFEVNISTESDKSGGVLREIMRTKGAELMRKKFVEFVTDLYESKTKHALLRSKQEPQKPAASKPVLTSSSASSGGEAPSTKEFPTLSILEEFHCPPQQIYSIFLDSNMVSGLTQSHCTIKTDGNCEFFTFGGSVTGNTEVMKAAERIEQKWRFSHWPQGHFSRVSMVFSQDKPGITTLKLTHSNIPKDDLERVEQGWRNFYFSRIRTMFGI